MWARGLGVAPLKKQCACTRLGASKDVQGSSAHWDRGDQQSIWSEAKWLPWGRSQHRDKGQRGRHDGTPASCRQQLSSSCGVSLTLLLAHLPRQSSLLPCWVLPVPPGYSQSGRLSDNPELPSPWRLWRWGWTPQRDSGPTPRPTAGEGAACESAADGAGDRKTWPKAAARPPVSVWV